MSSSATSLSSATSRSWLRLAGLQISGLGIPRSVSFCSLASTLTDRDFLSSPPSESCSAEFNFKLGMKLRPPEIFLRFTCSSAVSVSSSSISRSGIELLLFLCRLFRNSSPESRSSSLSEDSSDGESLGGEESSTLLLLSDRLDPSSSGFLGLLGLLERLARNRSGPLRQRETPRLSLRSGAATGVSESSAGRTLGSQLLAGSPPLQRLSPSPLLIILCQPTPPFCLLSPGTHSCSSCRESDCSEEGVSSVGGWEEEGVVVSTPWLDTSGRRDLL